MSENAVVTSGLDFSPGPGRDFADRRDFADNERGFIAIVEPMVTELSSQFSAGPGEPDCGRKAASVKITSEGSVGMSWRSCSLVRP